MHQKALLREEGLKQGLKEKNGQIRDLKNRLFGKKSEKKTSKTEKIDPKSDKNKTPRGQQPGSEGHGLTERPDLPVVDEQAGFPEDPLKYALVVGCPTHLNFRKWEYGTSNANY